MAVKRFWLALGLGLSLISCASTPEPKVSPVQDSAEAGLAPQMLAPGECGLFVWTADPARQFLLFSQSQKLSGVWKNGPAEQNLSIIDQSGDAAYRQFPVTQYTAPSGAALTLALRSRQNIDDGTRFKTGTLTVSEADAWDRIIPVVGLAACQPR